MAQILNGKVVSGLIKEGLKKRISKVYPPVLAVCLVGEDPASKVYVTNKYKACEEVGIKGIGAEFPEDTSQKHILNLIDSWNKSKEVNGILVQLPLPPHIDKNVILQRIDPRKDVDCFHPENQGLLMAGQPRFLPCTPSGIVEIFKYYDIPVKGSNVVIVNRSIVVGKPLAMLLSQDSEWGNATITLCHEHTKDIDKICRSADILVTAVGKRPYFKLSADMVEKHQVIIDVGINRMCIDGKNKIIGDVDFDEVSQKVSSITPCPGGVGPLTIACLLRNTLQAAEM